MSHTKTVTYWEGDDEITVEVPAIWEICSRCSGDGHHSNPAIDGNGIGMDEWYGPDWDDESRESYMSGAWDVRCEAGCKGGKILVVDRDRTDPKVLRGLEEGAQADADYAAEVEAEQRMGA